MTLHHNSTTTYLVPIFRPARSSPDLSRSCDGREEFELAVSPARGIGHSGRQIRVKMALSCISCLVVLQPIHMQPPALAHSPASACGKRASA